MNKIDFKKSFIDDLLSGLCQMSDIDKYINYWHNNNTKNSLHEFLGLNEKEYEKWLKNSDNLKEIISNKINK